ncbi:MAG: D-alanyl-D-alanine carboxypeptidase [Oscillospiraceae bacterium]|nr:D-alanyl-D-alanine carboxypeptidase [Oscillospiraceae bacterium]
MRLAATATVCIYLLYCCAGLTASASAGFSAAANLPASGDGDKPAGIHAVSAILYEVSAGTVLYERDADTPRPMASTTKLMTALLAAESGDLQRLVTVTAEAVRVEGSAVGLKAGDMLTLHDLLVGLLLSSGNDAANVIACTLSGSLPAFADRMNRRARAIGMTNSRFVTPSGLDAEGHAASARDMALLGAEVLKHPVLEKICSSRSMKIEIASASAPDSKRPVTLTNHNRLLSLYPDAVGLKTGFTKKSGRCLVSAARRDGVTLVAVTLNDGDDWDDHITLFDYGFSQVEAVSIPPPELPALPVAGGYRREVTLNTQPPPAWVLPKGDGSKVTVSIELPRFILAPVVDDQPVGQVRYLCKDEELAVIPILTVSAVEARPVTAPKQRFRERMRELWKILYS